MLGLSGARWRAHRGGGGSAPLAGEEGRGVWREGGLSLVTGTSLLPLAAAAAAAGRTPGVDDRTQAGLRPGGEVVNGTRQILGQKKRDLK